VRGQGFGGGVFAVEFGFREYGVDLLVAESTEESDGVKFGPAEVPAGAGSFVEGSWDKMVPHFERQKENGSIFSFRFAQASSLMSSRRNPSPSRNKSV
jgi:hypothetical protein